MGHIHRVDIFSTGTEVLHCPKFYLVGPTTLGMQEMDIGA